MAMLPLYFVINCQVLGMGFDVINGDESDLRFLDKQGVVVGLIEKGLAKKDETGFVQEGINS